MLTIQSFKALTLSAVLASVTGLSLSAKPAFAMTFTVDADVYNNFDGSDIGDLTGSFDYDEINGYSNINLFSTWTNRTYTQINQAASNGLQAFFSDPLSTFSGTQLKLTYSQDLGLTSPGASISLVNAASLNSLEGQTVDIENIGTFNLYAPVAGDITAVPTPALIPGLIGLGVAAYRKKRASDLVVK